ncbi:MAG: redoxin domain-containing protein, partial [Salibacteraceae bacterium]
LIDVFDRNIDLKAYRGKKVLVGFFRHAGCPFCNLRIHLLQKHSEAWKALGLELIFFFESGKSTLLRSIFHKEVSPIPLISDPEKIWYTSYGIEESLSKSRASHLTSFIQTAIKAKITGVPLHLMAENEAFGTMPAEFLLDTNQIIRKIHYSKGLTDRMSIDYIYDFAKGDERGVLR